MALLQVGVAQRFCSLWVGGGRWLQEVVGEADECVIPPAVISRRDAARGRDAKGSITKTGLCMHKCTLIYLLSQCTSTVPGNHLYYSAIVKRYTHTHTHV